MKLPRFRTKKNPKKSGIRNKILDFFPESGFFQIFFCTMSPRVMSGFRKTKLYKNLLRIDGGDSGHRNLFSNTHYTQHTTSGIYILMKQPLVVSIQMIGQPAIFLPGPPNFSVLLLGNFIFTPSFEKYGTIIHLFPSLKGRLPIINFQSEF